MGNILQEPFDSWVTKQIDVRQKSLGKVDIPANDYQHYTTKTPFLRLASSVDVKDLGKDSVFQKLIKSDVPKNKISGDLLAKNLILQGGVISESDKRLKYGLNDSRLFNGAQGFGDVKERGFVPLPGITSANVTYYNNGALSRTNIKVKCFSKSQFQLLDVLYLRPGYTLLLEFGWTKYLDNNGNLQSFDQFNTEPMRNFLAGGVDQYELYGIINDAKKEYYGNYEAIFGKVTNFNWVFQSDGSYDCDIQLTAVGDVIESLKTNISNAPDQSVKDLKSTGGFYSVDGEVKAREDRSNVKASKYSGKFGWTLQLWDYFSKNGNEEVFFDYSLEGDVYDNTILGNKLYNIYQSVVENADGEMGYYPIQLPKFKGEKTNQVEIVDPAVAGIGGSNEGLPIVIDENGFESTLLPQVTEITEGVKYNKGAFYINNAVVGDNQKGTQVYIKYGVLIALIQSHLLLYNKKNKTPLYQFDMDFSDFNKDKNIILNIPGQISADPSVCLIPWTNLNILNTDGDPMGYDYTEGGYSVRLNRLLKSSGFKDNDEVYIGKLANILVNIDYIGKILSQFTKDEDGNISQLDFLKSINQGIVEAIGNVNNLDLKLDSNGLKIKFIEEIPQRIKHIGNYSNKSSKNFAKFNIFGVKKGGLGGSFVRNINIQANLSNEFASMISIGAQASGNQVTGNATSFSNYNKGLVDRIIPEKLPSLNLESNESNIATKVNQISGLMSQQGINFINIYSKLNFTSENTNVFKTSMSEVLKLTQGILSDTSITTEERKSATGGSNPELQAPFFLPFNLSLEMDGLSGMVLYEKFRITDEVLPPSYDEDSLDIIIRGINHSINTQAWTTTLDTLSVPRFFLGEATSPHTIQLATGVIDPTSTTQQLQDRTSMYDESQEIQQQVGIVQPEVAMQLAYAKIPEDATLPRNGKETLVNGWEKGWCARYTYNLASYYSEYKLSTLSSPKWEIGVGYPNQNNFAGNIQRLGYTQLFEGSVDRESLVRDINRFDWQIGDVLVYWAGVGNNVAGASYNEFGHTQIYVGGESSSGWADSTKNNHNLSFVYPSVGKPTGKWNVRLFRKN